MASSSRPVATGEMRLNIPGAFVYRVYGHGDVLLYIGMTDNLHSRFNSHQLGRSPWMYEARRVMWTEYPTRAAAERAEARAIEAEHPLHNLEHNARRLEAIAMGHRNVYDTRAWRRLGVAIRGSRTCLEMTAGELAREVWCQPEDIRSLETGAATGYDALLLTRLELALRWRAGSLESVLGGGDFEVLGDQEFFEAGVAAGKWVRKAVA